jgi:uncharacterized membrane protein
MMRTRIYLLAAALLAVNVLLAQGTTGDTGRAEGHAYPGNAIGRDTSESDAASPRDEGASEPAYVLKPWRALFGHLHNKVIHVPIGFAMSAFLLSLLALRWSELQPAIRWLVLVAALGSLVAYLTGTHQATFLEGGSKDWVIDIHEDFGIASACTLWVWAASFWVRPLKKWSILFAVLAMFLIIVTGFFGGVLAHG